MPTVTQMRQCEQCGQATQHIQNRRNHILHLLLSVFTLGIWLPIWLILAATTPNPQCTVCGQESEIVNVVPIVILGILLAVAMATCYTAL